MTTDEEQPIDPIEERSDNATEDPDSEISSSASTPEQDETSDQKPLKSEVGAQRSQDSEDLESDETQDSPTDLEPRLEVHNLDSVLVSLETYEASLAGNNQPLATTLSLYRAQLSEGIATHAPPAITPELVGESLLSGKLKLLQNMFEHLRNAFIFMPVLWTWLQIGLAIGAYSAIKEMDDIAYKLDADKSFLDLWAEGFKGYRLPDDYSPVISGLKIIGIGVESFQTTALIAVGFIAALVIMTFLVGILRSINNSRLQKYRRDFAGILGQASFLHINLTAETPQEQIFEFSRIARQLTGSIQTLTTAFQAETASMSSAIQSAQATAEQSAKITQATAEQSAASMSSAIQSAQTSAEQNAKITQAAAEQSAKITQAAAEQSAEMAKTQFELVNNSVSAMNTSMTTLTGLVDKQATQLGDVIESLSDVSNLAEQLGEIRQQFAETSTSLTNIESEFGPAATILTESVTLMNDLVTKLDQASANLGKALLQHDNFTTKMNDAAQSINLVSNRFLDATEKE